MAIATWNISPQSLKPVDVIDYDYRAALEWAATDRLSFGSHLVFTFGPLGFLASPVLFFAVPAFFGFAFLTALKTCTGCVIYRSLRSSAPAVAALLFSYLVMALISPGFAVEFLVPLGFVWAVKIVDRPGGRRLGEELVMAGGFTAVAGLIKVSLGPPVLLVFVVAWALRPDRAVRQLGGYIGGLAVAFAAVWLATGNSLLSVFTWLRLEAAFISGYSAMASEMPGRLYSYWLAGVAIVTVVVIAGLRGFQRGGLPHAAGWILMTLVVTEVLFRESFVRHDQHDVLFLAATPLLFIAVAGPAQRRVWRVQPALLLTVAVCESAVVGVAPSLVARPQTAAHLWLSDGKTIVLPSDRRTLEAEGRSGLQGIYRLPSSWLTEMRGQRVAAAPRGQPMAWTYPQLRWQPMPTIQEYTAYTSSLDNLDASFFGSQDAPPWVLQQSFGLDGRNPAWDSPAAELALRCNYRVVSTDSPFLTLLHRTHDMCGRAQPLADVHAKLGRAVTIPAPAAGMALVTTIHTSPSLAGLLAGAVFKGGTYSVIVNNTTRYRFVTGTGSSAHLLNWPVDSGTTMAVPAVHSLTVVSNDPWASKSSVDLRLSEIPVGR
ncbi:hypothetical protein K6U06_17080 [Acidiferrimicrobium sp. IK]|uniref:hypothetical protein n=1 Tax=Acidiferrimicrobium sp. IK TaxID=2871700 RepID=UPI0021CAE6CE|nr:hypothetical protein [Acidiferrimicrobium sp. IK]MCU4186086.1 hypothetical protein [Acidiferrimicrobium sp. IK]